jgi:hypothetical protein
MTTEGDEKRKRLNKPMKKLHMYSLGYARTMNNVGVSNETPVEKIPFEIKVCFQSCSSVVHRRFQNQRKKEGGIEDVCQLFSKQRTDVERNRRVCSIKQAGCVAGFVYLLSV